MAAPFTVKFWFSGAAMPILKTWVRPRLGTGRLGRASEVPTSGSCGTGLQPIVNDPSSLWL